jgi:hypothetical protein
LSASRLFFIQLYRWFPSILKAMTIIRPETLLRWHRVRELDATLHLALQHGRPLPERGKSALGLEDCGKQVQEQEYRRPTA